MNGEPMKWYRVFCGLSYSQTIGYVQTNVPKAVQDALDMNRGSIRLIECPDPTVPTEPCCQPSTRSVRRYYEGEGRGSRMRCEVVPISSIGTIGREMICIFDGYPDRYAIEIVGESYWVGCDETGTIIEFGG